MLNGKSILLIVGGGIAAFKALDLVRRLRERGAAVTPVLTGAGAEFVTPLSLSALAGQQVYRDLFDLTAEAEMGHIELSRASDMVVVAPATADLMGKMAGGLADDLASTLLLATDKRVLIAPAMNVRMWDHPATRRNAERLRADGILFAGPTDGNMACGEYGPGRMAEPLEIVSAIETALGQGPLTGRHVLVTSGPTHEPIDPVRYIANRSSGAQGTAIAAALRDLGAQVTFVTGPAVVPAPAGVDVVPVETARQMLAAVEAADPADAAIFAAAVADWHVTEASHQKIKKGANGLPELGFAENPDILFIFVTAPPQCWADADPENAKRARDFYTWLKDEWFQQYQEDSEEINNVAIFDWFDVLAYGEDATQHANMLKEKYGGNTGDSHPNALANSESTELFASGEENLLDRYWRTYDE